MINASMKGCNGHQVMFISFCPLTVTCMYFDWPKLNPTIIWTMHLICMVLALHNILVKMKMLGVVILYSSTLFVVLVQFVQHTQRYNV